VDLQGDGRPEIARSCVSREGVYIYLRTPSRSGTSIGTLDTTRSRPAHGFSKLFRRAGARFLELRQVEVLERASDT
jgi:hypothetical protein